MQLYTTNNQQIPYGPINLSYLLISVAGSSRDWIMDQVINVQCNSFTMLGYCAFMVAKGFNGVPRESVS